MTLLYPWGLLALLAIPVILGLHFFRQQRRTRQIGGLHLWDFARVATPAGRRFERLRSSLPLLFQLLAAILLALLLAGLDLPVERTAGHYTIVLDDSISMTARSGGKSSAQRAAEALTRWAPAGDRFTLVLAGNRPVVAAGPGATRADFLNALADWQPRSDRALLDQALNIAQKFSTENSRLIVMTDDPSRAKGLGDGVVPWAVGLPAGNHAITFADRFRPSKDAERIVATIQRFGHTPAAVSIAAYAGPQQVASRPVTLETSAPVTIQFDFPPVDAPLRLALSPDDALAADNEIVLRPPVIKPVRVMVAEDLPRREAFEKAALAVPDVTMAKAAADADLAFVAAPAEAPGVRRVYQFRGAAETTGALRTVEGRNLMLADASPLTQDLYMEGVLWPFSRDTPPDPRAALRADIAFTSIPLVYQDGGTSASRLYRVNLALQPSNIIRQTAWPVLVLNMIEECREALPGINRANLRSGEAVRLSLPEGPDTAQPEISLWKDDAAQPAQTWQGAPPEVLSDLESGSWTIRRGTRADAPVVAQFQVNLFSPDESNLQAAASVKPDFKALSADAAPRTQQNYLLFYALLIALLGCIILGWIYHDAGH